MKGKDPKELVELTFHEKMRNFFAPSQRWEVVEGAGTDEGVLVSGSIEINFAEKDVQYLHIDPHLLYLLLKDGTIITYLPGTDTLILS